ncbi:hypothetical protein HKCCE2091_07130 [Rhodobacterales bacterium HKCCE2091]|nr:hypothetical protein [Rhodobacterales bacterium HKCCE2091]
MIEAATEFRRVRTGGNLPRSPVQAVIVAWNRAYREYRCAQRLVPPELRDMGLTPPDRARITMEAILGRMLA